MAKSMAGATKTYYAENISQSATKLGVFTNGKYRLLELKTDDNIHKHKNMVIQFCRGGDINSTFGVSKNQYGKTLLTFSVGNYEADCFKKWEEHVINSISERKDELWLGKPITKQQIKDNFARMIGEKRPMKDGSGFWPGMGKVNVPFNKDTGDVKATIQDESGNNVDLYDVMGRKWQKIVVKIEAIYFNGKFICGFGPKVLHTLVVENEETEQIIELLPELPPVEEITQGKKKKRKLASVKK
jgi:hypothetical protein